MYPMLSLSQSMMSDSDKVKINPLAEKSYFALWRILVHAAMSAKGLQKILVAPDYTTSPLTKLTEENKEKACNIIIADLGEKAIRAVSDVIKNLFVMKDNLDSRYNSKSMATRIAKFLELSSIKYASIKDDMSRHIDRLTGLIAQLHHIGTNFDETITIGILVTLIEAQ